MKPRIRHLPFVLAAGVIAALLTGGPAQSQTATSASIEAADNPNRFKAPDGSSAVTIQTGGRVDFSYPIGTSLHNVNFTGAKPSSCTQTAGNVTGDVPPLPTTFQRSGWAGYCIFSASGTYAFVCDAHPNMTGSVTVVTGGGTTTDPTTTATTPPPPPPPGTTPPPPPPPPSAVAGRAASAPRVDLRQRGFAIRGSVHVTSAGSRLLVRAFARRKALFGSRSSLQVRVGRTLRPSVGGRRVAFSVRLDGRARRALRRNGRLAINLRLTVTPPSGAAYTATRIVFLRAA